MIEGLAWGKEWQLGYEKDPPLFPWLIYTITLWSGKKLWISYLAGQLCVATVFFSVWQLGRRIASEKEALVGALLLEGVYYFNLPSLEFNDILLQMPFAALFGWLLHKAIIENRLRDWFFSGIVASLGLWSRYSMGACILPLALLVVLHPAARRRLASPGPWLLMGTSTVLFLPHFYWMITSNFISIKYVGNRAPVVLDAVSFIEETFSFLGAQLMALLPMLAVTVMLWRWRSSRSSFWQRWQNFDFAYLAVLSLGPLLFSLTLSLVTTRPLRAMWGANLWSFIGLFAVVLLQPLLTDKRMHKLLRAWVIVCLLPVAFFLAEKHFATLVTGNEKNVDFPGQELGRKVNERWRAATGQPLKYVVGDTWSAGNVSFYADDRPSAIFTHGDFRICPWVDLHQLERAGAILLWDVKEEGSALPPHLAEKFPKAVADSFITVEGKRPHQFGIAFLLPQS